VQPLGPTNGKIVLQRQTAHADAVAGLPLPGLRRTAEPVRSTRLQVATENAGPENAGLENDGLEFDGPEQRAVMSLVQEHMHTLKTVPDFLKLIFLP